jgi:hypothetical protein
MKEVSFIGTTLSNSVLRIATYIFNDTQLKEVNFLTAYNYKIDPDLTL